MNLVSSYKVFARKYRPQMFREIVGQEVAVQIFQNALRQNTLSHAILLTGIRGIGKTTSARLLAKTLCCEAPSDHVDPCGSCGSCLAFQQERHTDIVEMDAASHTGVDDIRDIIEGVAYSPTYGRYRVYIIDEVHMLSKNAFNALLKTLEEPPAHAKFIFATTEFEKVPETILSRCLQIQLRPISPEIITDHLNSVCLQEAMPTDRDGLGLIADAAQGSMRDALSLLEKVASFTRSTGETMAVPIVERILGRPPQQSLQELCAAIMSGNIAKAIEITRVCFSQDIEPLAIAKSLLNALHSSLCRTMGVHMHSNLFGGLSVPQLNRLWALVHRSVEEISTSLLPKESCEVMMMRLCHVSDFPPLTQLIQDVEQQLRTLQSADVSTTSQTQTVSSMLSTFDALVNWVDSQKDPHLSYFLKREIRVHGFTPGHIECSLVHNADQGLLQQLKQLLKSKRNETWTFELVHVTTSPSSTLHEQYIQRDQDAQNQALQSELVQHALNSFSGATIRIEKQLVDA